MLNLHLHFWTIKYRCLKDITYSINPVWCYWAHLTFPSPSWKIAGFLLSAWGACFFKPTPGMRLQMLIVCYLVTTSVMLTRPFLWEGLERKFPTIKKKVFLSLSNAIVCCLVEFVVQFTCHFHSTFFLLLMMGCFSSCFLRFADIRESC